MPAGWRRWARAAAACQDDPGARWAARQALAPAGRCGRRRLPLSGRGVRPSSLGRWGPGAGWQRGGWPADAEPGPCPARQAHLHATDFSHWAALAASTAWLLTTCTGTAEGLHARWARSPSGARTAALRPTPSTARHDASVLAPSEDLGQLLQQALHVLRGRDVEQLALQGKVQHAQLHLDRAMAQGVGEIASRKASSALRSTPRFRLLSQTTSTARTARTDNLRPGPAHPRNAGTVRLASTGSCAGRRPFQACRPSGLAPLGTQWLRHSLRPACQAASRAARSQGGRGSARAPGRKQSNRVASWCCQPQAARWARLAIVTRTLREP